MKRALGLLLLTACATTPRPGIEALTVERIYSEPSLSGSVPSNVQWSPNSMRVAYLHDGGLYVFVWDTKEKRRLAEAPAWYAWRGARLAMLVGQKLVEIDPASLQRSELCTWKGGQNLTMSPDGKCVSFIREHDLWIQLLADGVEKRLTTGGSETLLNGELDWVYPEELGFTTGHWWSPDSTKIAFLQLDETGVSRFPLVDWKPINGKVEPMFYPKAGEKNPKARLGIAGITGSVQVTDFPAEYIARISWSGVSEPVVQLLTRNQDQLTISEPMSLNGWDTDETEHAKIGWIEARPEICRDQTGQWLLTANSDGNQIERHLWRVSFDGTEREKLTIEPGWHSPIVSPDGTKWIDQYSRIDRPPTMPLLTPNEVDLSKYDFVPVEFTQVKAPDGMALDAMIMRPRDSGRHPVIVHVYGGPGAQSVANRWNGRNYLWHQLMVKRGFAVVVLDNRCSGARGQDVVRQMHKQLGTIEVRDLSTGVDWIKKQPWAIPDRLGLWGWSYGGYMTCLAMCKLDCFKAGVAVAPVTDWRDYDTIYTERYMLRPQDNPDGYKESAPVTHAANLHGRLLLVHGLADDNVHFQNTVHFTDALIKHGRQFDQLVYPGRNHGIGDKEARIHLFNAMTAFFERQLKP